MKKQRFFVIKTREYGTASFYFQDLDGAMKMFKFLMEGNAIEISHKDVPVVEEADKNGYRSRDYFDYIGKEQPEYHLSSEIKEIYTKEEIEEIEKERKKKIKELEKK